MSINTYACFLLSLFHSTLPFSLFIHYQYLCVFSIIPSSLMLSHFYFSYAIDTYASFPLSLMPDTLALFSCFRIAHGAQLSNGGGRHL